MSVIIQYLHDEYFYILGINVALYVFIALKLKNLKHLNLFTFYLFLIYLNQIIASYYTLTEKNNLFLFHIYLLIQFIFLSFFYKSLFTKKQGVYVNILLVIVLLFLSGYYILWPEDFAYFNLPEILITTLPILGYIMLHFYNSLVSEGKYLILSGGLLIYLSISSLIFLLYAIDINNDVLANETSHNLAEINVVAYMLLQLVLLIEWKLNISKWKIRTV